MSNVCMYESRQEHILDVHFKIISLYIRFFFQFPFLVPCIVCNMCSFCNTIPYIYSKDRNEIHILKNLCIYIVTQTEVIHNRHIVCELNE